MGLLWYLNQYDSIWFVVDRMTKSANCMSVRTTYSSEDNAKLFIEEIVRQHRASVSIISYCGTQLSYNIFCSFYKGLGAKENLSITFHPQMDGRIE